jgi:hypothetical protein
MATKSEAQRATRLAQASLDQINADRRAATLSGQTADDIYRRNVEVAQTQKQWTAGEDVPRSE